MSNAKPHEKMDCRFRRRSPVTKERVCSAALAVAAALLFTFAEGCKLLQPGPEPVAQPVSRRQSKPKQVAGPPRSTIQEEELAGPPELEGPPLPPQSQQEQEFVGPPLPSAGEASTLAALPGNAGQQGPAAQLQTLLSARGQALLAGLVRKNVTARASARGVVIVLPETMFGYGTADLPRASRRSLHDIASTVLEGAAGVPISVEAHTDSIGADMFNQGLSERRAKAVAAELAASGIPEKLLRSQGFGARFPIAPNSRPDGTDDPEGRALNRRVEIVVETEATSGG